MVKSLCNRNAPIQLRPHHGLCSQFFCGHGYSEAFTQHMGATLELLGRQNLMITLTTEADEICSHCPNRVEHSCNAIEKVTAYDKAVLTLCQLQPGTQLSWQAFCQLVEEKILTPGKLEEVCGDCTWAKICENKSK